MTHQDVERDLLQLARRWPLRSVADVVMDRIERQPPDGWTARWPRRRRVALAASSAAMLALCVTLALVMAAPRTLQAQVQQAIAKAGAAHVVISTLDAQGVKRRAEIWYSRDHGFAAESPDEVIVDDGIQQLSWRPATDAAQVVVSRRPSGNAIEMITNSFQLENVPLKWSRARAPEFDRQLHDQPCQAYLITPADSADLQMIVLADPQQRVVQVTTRRQTDGRWQPQREFAIDYDVAVPAEKFAANIPQGARIVDADRFLAELYPLDKALATSVAEGLQFAIHDARRVNDDMVFVLSSVRGTPEYLREHPPVRRRLNLQTTLFDVARQPEAPGNGDGCNRATLAAAESAGVHYLWWLAVKRRYYSVEDGVETFRFEDPGLEIAPDHIQLNLAALPSAARDWWIATTAKFNLPADSEPLSLEQVAARVRSDVLAIRQDPSAIVAMHGGMTGEQMHYADPAAITDADYAKAISEQLQWLHSLDEVEWPPAALGGADVPQ